MMPAFVRLSGFLMILVLLGLASGLVIGCGKSVEEPLGGCSGRVVDSATGTPVPNCSVTIAEGVGAVTDGSGMYVIDDVKAGSYVLSTVACGYTRTARQVQVVQYQRDPTTKEIIRKPQLISEIRISLDPAVIAIASYLEYAIRALVEGGVSLPEISWQQVGQYARLTPMGTTIQVKHSVDSALHTRDDGCRDDGAWRDDYVQALIENSLALVKEGWEARKAVLEAIRVLQ